MPRRLTQEEFENKFYHLYSKDEYQILSEYKNAKTNIRIKHIPCGSEYERTPDCLSRSCNCPKCIDIYPRVVPYVNDLWITNPEIAKLLVNPEDGHKVKKDSPIKMSFKCPKCNGIFERSVGHMTRRDFSCPFCGDGTSYAERLFGNILHQLEIPFKREFSPKWIRPYLYDFCFEMDKKYIVELDGGWHYCDNLMSGITKEKAKEIDNYKDQMAREHGYFVIRIDVAYGSSNRYEYIKNSLIKSDLKTILNLDSIDFNQCHTNAVMVTLSNEIVEMWLSGIRNYSEIARLLNINQGTVQRHMRSAVESNTFPYTKEQVKQLNDIYWRENVARKTLECKDDVISDWMGGTHHFPSIAKKYNINRHTVACYIKDACQKKIIPFSYEEVIKKNKLELYKYGSPHYGQKILCNETGEIFDNYEQADKKYHAKVSVYFSCGRNYTGTLPDGTKLTWQKVYDD